MRPLRLLGIGLIFVGVVGNQAQAKTITITAPELPETLAAAETGDTIRVLGGQVAGPIMIDRSVQLVGEDWPVIDGGGSGTVVTVRAPRVEFRGFVIRGSGSSLDDENSGIAIEAPEALVEGNRLEDVLFGIYLRKASGSIVRGNRISGKDLLPARRGDAIRVWYSNGTEISHNVVQSSRDVVLWYSDNLLVLENDVRDGRYGLHFMYCDDARIEGNLLLNNSVGAFLMYSRRLRLVGNTIADNHGPSGYGVGLKDMDDAHLRDNLLMGNRVGVFLDNSPREMTSTSVIEGNRFAANDFGIVLMPNVRRAEISRNDFIDNTEQVSIAGAGGDATANTWLGNYWSDYAGFDEASDGIGDLPYRSEKLFENLADRRPQLRLFTGSPISRALEFAARALPAVRPRPKLVDEHPRVRPAELADVPALPQYDTAGGWAAVAGGSMLLVGFLLGSVIRQRRSRPGAIVPAAPGVSSSAKRVSSHAPILSLSSVTKRYGDKEALSSVSFTVEPGEAVALWGPNGAGKTTALLSLMGLITFEGEIRVDELDPRVKGRSARAQIGFVPQEIGIQGDIRVEEIIRFISQLRRVPVEATLALAVRLGLEDHLTHEVSALSGGLRQRLALVLALASDPPILLLDEPSANLDSEGRRALLEFLGKLKADGKTLVFTSHREEEVRFLADRVLHLADGRLLRESTTEVGPDDRGLHLVTPGTSEGTNS